MNNSASTLILSIVILTAVLATAITFGIIALSNFKQASSIDQAILSYYLAEAGVERGIYYFRQFNEDALTCNLSGCDLEIQPQSQVSISSLSKDTSTQIDIYDPNGADPDIQYLIPTWDVTVPQGWLEASWVGWTGSSFSDPVKKLLTDPASSSINLHDAGAYNFYRVRFKALIADVSNLQIIAQDSGFVQKPIPGLAEIKATGSYRNSQQAIAVNANHLSPLSGLYDYVIFSEEELVKAYCGDGVVEGSEQCDDGRDCGNVTSTDCTNEPEGFCDFGDLKCLPRDDDGCSAACEREPKTIIYVTTARTDGGLGGRSGADAYCENNMPVGLECNDIHAFLSVSDTDEIRDMPTNYGYDSSKEVYWYNSVTTVLTKLANDWNDMLDIGGILVSQEDGTGVGCGAGDNPWTGSHWSGAVDNNNNCNGFTDGTATYASWLGSCGTILNGWMNGGWNHCNVTPERIRCICLYYD